MTPDEYGLIAATAAVGLQNDQLMRENEILRQQLERTEEQAARLFVEKQSIQARYETALRNGKNKAEVLALLNRRLSE